MRARTVFWIASTIYATLAADLDTMAVMFGLDGACRLLSTLVGGKAASYLYAAGTLATESSLSKLIVRPGSSELHRLLCSCEMLPLSTEEIVQRRGAGLLGEPRA